jgi:hypothetical protein
VKGQRRFRAEKAGSLIEGLSGKLCAFAALREALSQKGICSRKGAKTQRNAEPSIAEKPRARTAK